MKKMMIVAAGGASGTLFRYWLQVISFHLLGPSFPFGTFLVNSIGCFLAGFLGAMIRPEILYHPYFKLFIFVGFLGGFTTYSGFAFETWTLAKDQEFLKAGLNLCLHIFGCFAALVGGIWVSRLI
ncbi:MAG: fluoride efflux transporter CrcB [Deltaproteobacteria bacterium]|nr:fluoride efflux transporter CrcB [Deltaproteobacteria bacterium]